jgi:aldehyde:ferredoxin oxidoreductase
MVQLLTSRSGLRRRTSTAPSVGLHVDLGAGRAEREELPPETARAYVGGRGLGVHLLLRRRVHEVDPLSPASPLIIAPGPLTGSAAPATGRYSISARSPLTGTAFDGNSGGGLGIALRRCGLDYLVVDGACDEASYVVVDDAGARLRPAGDLWGLDAPATLARLRSLHGRCEAAVIGRAGENGVLFASIVNDRGRQVGRGGLGAIMGAKRLKAIVLAPSGRAPTRPADPEGFEAAVREVTEQVRSNPATGQQLPRFGTSVLVHLLDRSGVMPTRNFRDSQFELADAICGESLRVSSGGKSTACAGCPVGCARDMASARGRGRGPEYENIWALGAACGIGDLDAIVTANHACNDAGLDAITMGSTIACAMELTELGLLPGGPRFGEADALLRLVDDTVARRGLGEELAGGSRSLAAAHGRPELSMSVKGLELPAFDPRGMTGQGLAFATSNRGGCHTRANTLGYEIVGVPERLDRFATAGKARPVIAMQDLNAALDSLVGCKFAAFALTADSFARLLGAMVGAPIETGELLAVGERIWNAERLFNLRAGFTRADDTLPARLLEEPVASGPCVGHVVDLEPMLDEYYHCRGWDDHGVPTAAKLAELSLSRDGPPPSRIDPI